MLVFEKELPANTQPWLQGTHSLQAPNLSAQHGEDTLDGNSVNGACRQLPVRCLQVDRGGRHRGGDEAGQRCRGGVVEGDSGRQLNAKLTDERIAQLYAPA